MICNKITDSLFKSNMKNRFIVSVDDLPFRYDKSDEEMHVIANNIIRKKTNVHNAIIELKEVDSKKINGIQLCDLLLGSVLSQYQNDSLSERKREVANFVAHHLGWESLSHDTLPVEKKFNIWNFHDPTKGPRIVRSRKVKLKYEMPYKEE
ncbi:hypothetical protein NMV35_12020 [Pasteurella multocida]|nr:DUF3800 domain-containing protein [Pasteurella multocida]MDY0516172.1 hypothetical protein [Pasteurella multocida]WGL67285.1 hypothetical protein QFH15_02960 [Pasteurella multocida]